MLCGVCAAIDFKALLTPDTDPGDPVWRYKAKHHASSQSLIIAAEMGCELCRLLLDADTRHYDTFDNEDLETIAGHDIGPFELVACPFSCHRRHATETHVCSAIRHQAASPQTNYRFLEVATLHERLPYVPHREAHDGPDFELWRDWIADCINYHSECPALRHTELPTRVLELSGPSEDEGVRLVNSENMYGTYIALSHAWGGIVPLRTTRDNMERHLRGITLAELPRTFADAVFVCRALGVRYLWIDSLCIIQGDEDDWRQEVSRMATVYSKAVLTIAAAGAGNATEGLFVSEAVDSVSARPCTVRLSDIGEGLGNDLLIMPGSQSEPWPGRVPFGTPLAKRAWVLQERLLSARVLGFVAGRCYFECNGIYCDDHLRQPTQPFFRFSLSIKDYVREEVTRRGTARRNVTRTKAAKDLDNVRWDWYAVLQEYSTCSLTEGKDKLSALSAIALVLGKSIASPYVAGLWLHDLAFGLAWICEGSYPQDLRPSIRVAACPAPSWSWASCDRPIRLPWRTPTGNTTAQWRTKCTTLELEQGLRMGQGPGYDTTGFWVPCLDVDDVEMELADPSNPYGEVVRCKLTVSSKLRPLSKLDHADPGWKNRMGHANSTTATSNIITHWWFDAEEHELAHDGELCSLLLGSFVDCRHVAIVYAMILQQVEPNSDTFRRLGISNDTVPMGRAGEAPAPLVLDAQYRTIKLI